jgi:hypothetical protein
MTRRSIFALAVAVLSVAAPAPKASAQHLHTNHRWDECAIVLDPALTRDAWRQFVTELGIVTYFRPMASAKPLGRRNFEIGLLDWSTQIDDADDAWNDTFSHPDSTHYLFEGSALHIPGLTARVGVTDRIDVGMYFTKNVNSNYGFVGGQVQYSLRLNEERRLSAAGRLSVVRLFGPDDVQASTYGLDVLVSKEVWRLEPYAGVSGYMARGRETTTKVDLDAETAFGAQATLGVTARVSYLRLAAEYHAAKVPGVSMKVAFGN